MRLDKTLVFEKLSTPALPGWAILPLRLFLGVSFLSAGLDKLGDPAFLDPAARDYIGRQITRFAPGTPLEGFLTSFAVPNADLFGVMVMGGELCIAIGVLLGLLTRFSAFMGMLLNLTFFLSATWGVRPFYFGADLPYTVAWLTLLLAGPGPLSLDAALGRRLASQPELPGLGARDAVPGAASAMTRRAFLGLGAAGLAGAALASVGPLWGLLHPGRAEALGTATPTAEPATPPAPTPTPQGAPATPSVPATAEAVARRQLAAAGALPGGQALEFTLPTGQPAVLVHNEAGYSAYVTLCTHQGCIVHPNADRSLLVCPCHGAQYDPSAKGEVVRGPAPLPLSPVAITVDPDGSVYLGG